VILLQQFLLGFTLMFKIITSILRKNQPHPEAKWNYVKSNLFILILTNQGDKNLVINSDMSLKDVSNEISRWRYQNLKLSNPEEFEKSIDLLCIFDECYCRYEKTKSEIWKFYWSEIEKKKGMKSYHSNGRSRHITYEEYYQKLSPELRVRVLELEKLSDKELIEYVMKIIA
jgi:hypothetical protein